MLQGIYKLIPADQDGINPGQLVEIVTKAQFVGADSSVLVSIGDMTEIRSVICEANVLSVPSSWHDVLFSDRIISNNSITIYRWAGVNDLKIYVRIVGR